MNSSFISMVDKAKRYAEEPQRISFAGLEVDFRGNNGTHRVALRGGEWSCECDHFQMHALCAHVMTLQRVFASHLATEARFTQEKVAS